MRKLTLTPIVALLSFCLVFLYACTKENNETVTSDNNAVSVSAKGSPRSTSKYGDYNIVTSVSADGKVWTYTITRATTRAKNLSHLIIDLNNCGDQSATFANIVSATVNGLPANLEPNEGWGTGCDPQSTTTNFVKINFSSATSWVLVITFDRGYETFTTAKAWVKAGTSCTSGLISAPGCPKTDYCSFSQGYFFANGTFNNGASVLWEPGLTIGGITYTQIQGNNFWNIDRGRGGDQTMNGFFQLGAVRLSGVESEVAADAAIIDAYFTGLDVTTTITTVSGSGGTYQYFNLPATNNGITKAQVITAGSSIGGYIDANHCD
jgi:hypothetical protein